MLEKCPRPPEVSSTREFSCKRVLTATNTCLPAQTPAPEAEHQRRARGGTSIDVSRFTREPNRRMPTPSQLPDYTETPITHLLIQRKREKSPSLLYTEYVWFFIALKNGWLVFCRGFTSLGCRETASLGKVLKGSARHVFGRARSSSKEHAVHIGVWVPFRRRSQTQSDRGISTHSLATQSNVTYLGSLATP